MVLCTLSAILSILYVLRSRWQFLIQHILRKNDENYSNFVIKLRFTFDVIIEAMIGKALYDNMYKIASNKSCKINLKWSLKIIAVSMLFLNEYSKLFVDQVAVQSFIASQMHHNVRSLTFVRFTKTISMNRKISRFDKRKKKYFMKAKWKERKKKYCELCIENRENRQNRYIREKEDTF